ncbi:MAG: amino acid adenylation domain-containing protein [Rhizobacter sp.]
MNDIPTAVPMPTIDPRLTLWNRTDVPLPPRSRLEQWVSAQCERTPSNTAVVAGDGSLTYLALEDRANQFAQVLRARGAGPGALVGVCMGRGLDLAPALLGVLKAGAAYVPLDPGFPAARLRDMAEDAELHTVITEARHAGLAGLPREQQLRVDDDAAELAAASVKRVPPPLDSPDSAPAYVIYTSGSTGKPKGVVLPQQAVCNFLASMQREPGLRPKDRLLAVTTLSFDISVLEIFLPLLTGARLVLAEREDAMDADTIGALIARHGINVLQATPTTWYMLLDAGWRAPTGFRAMCGGEPMTPPMARRLLDAGVELWNMYGPTETTVWSTVTRITDASQRITIGGPIANTQVWVVDDHLKPVAVGAEGEICIGGLGVANGYFRRPELTADRFVQDPFSKKPGARLYRTGDLGRWDEEGRLIHLGRLDFQVKVRGYRIELGEIESRLAMLPGVARTVVVARGEPPGDVRLVAYAACAPGASPDPVALREALKVGLPDYMVPHQVIVLDTLPLLPNGKIDRKSLPVPEAVVSVTAPPALPDDAPLAQHVAAAMAEALGVPSVAPDDHFFTLGGHSLLGARLMTRLGTRVGRRVGLRLLFAHPTPATLAAALEALEPQAAAPSLVTPRADAHTAPLTLAQQRLWYVENLTPGTPFNQLPTAQRLKGPLDEAALRGALQQFVDRQAALRTVIERTEDGARQRVLDRIALPLPTVEALDTLPVDEREGAARARIDVLSRQVFDLEHGPAFRFHLFRLGAEDHVLFFNVHHIVWDGASGDVMQAELAALYAAAVEGRAPALAPLEVTYGDFAEWQRQWMAGPEPQRQLAAWQEVLTPLPETLELPQDQPRPTQMTGDGASVHLHLSADFADAVRQAARQQGVSVATWLLAAWAAQLHRVSNQTDFAVATPVHGREQPALESVAGFFINTLPLRMRPDGAMAFGDWSRTVHDVMGAAYAHPDVALDRLVQALAVPRDTSRQLLAQVLYAFQDQRARPGHWGPLATTPFDVGVFGSTHDLSLYCNERADGIECLLTFNLDVFDAVTAGQHLTRLEHLLRQVVATPALTLNDIDLTPPADLALLAAWNDTAVAFDHAATVVTRIAETAARHGNTAAIDQPGVGVVTHGELDTRANRLAHFLRQRGVGRGDLVGLCIDRGIEMVVAQLAILKAGAAYVPLDPAYPADRLAYMAEDAKLALLVTESALVSAIDWPRSKSVLVDIDRFTIDTLPGTALVPDALRDAQSHDTAYVIYTSGSTGKPKGVMVPHGAVVNFIDSMARAPGLVAGDRLVAVTTLSFDIAVLELLLPLSVGATILLASRDTAVDGQALRLLIESNDVEVMQATPSTWRLLIDAGWSGSSTFKALIGGEGLPADLATQLLARTGQLWNMYGPTETTVWSTCSLVRSLATGIDIGTPIANTQIHVLDERLRPRPVGATGEIWIGGDGVTLGYLRRPELTAERFIDDPFRPGKQLYRTGDRGRWRHDGRLEHLGRLDFQVKVRGYRIELGEIESVLLQHPQVARALVIVREDQPGDLRLTGYVVARDADVSQDVLRSHLREHLPEYMVPPHVMVIDAIPLLPNGKTDRNALPAPSASGEGGVRAVVAPTTAAETVLAGIWKELLGTDRVGTTDNFFDLGGHSLLAMRAVLLIEQRLGLRINVRRLIFETLSQIAAGATVVDDTAPSVAAPAAETARRIAAPAAPATVERPRGLRDRIASLWRAPR